MKRFAAFACAGIPPSFARLGRAGVADQLRGKVLDLELAGGERRSAKKVGAASVAEGVGGAIRVFAVAQRSGKFRGGGGPGAHPEGRITLELAEEISFRRVVRGRIGGEVEFTKDPRGDGLDGEGFGLDRFWIGREALVEFYRLFEALLRRGFWVEPGKPAEICKNGVTDFAFRGRLQVTVVLEIKP